MKPPEMPRGRPGEKAAHSKNIATDDNNESSRIHRRYWAQQLLDAGDDYPVYGSPEWCALSLEDPRRVAACVHAAEIYTRDWYDNLEVRLRTEVEEMSRAHKRQEDLEYAHSFANKLNRTGGRVLTTFEERRSLQLEAAKPRDDDRRGDGQVRKPTLAPAPPGKWDSRFWGGDAG